MELCFYSLHMPLSHSCRQLHLYVISSFHRDVHEICPILGYYAAGSDNFLPTFRDNLSAPSSTVRNLIHEPCSPPLFFSRIKPDLPTETLIIIRVKNIFS